MQVEHPLPTKTIFFEAMNESKYEMHLILNTHWDREYRWSFRETQARLLEAGDILLDAMEKDPRFAYFHPDAQSSFLEDYLEFRPERRPLVEKLVKEERLHAGPWYTLPAEFLVSGEALVRNLLLGHRIAESLGGVMKCAYNIFSWGQVSQLPQIYRQFGMDTILFYRGIDQSNIENLEFWWDAPDGSRVMGFTFGSFHRLNFWIYVYNPYIRGTGGASSLPTGDYDLESIQQNGGIIARLADTYSTDDMNYHVLRQPIMKSMEAALKGMETLRDTVKDKASTRHLLFYQGFDQENPDPHIPDLVEEINKRIDYGKVTISSLPEVVKTIRKEMAESGADKNLLRFQGEMLSVETKADAFAPLYIGVFSARMPLKLQNADCQHRLEKWAETTSSWQLLQGQAYPETLLRSAWKEILQNQQHDGIGGCHIDRVQLAMEERYRIANDISECVTRDNLKSLVARIDHSAIGNHELGVTVFNSTSASRSEVVEVSVDIPIAWGFRNYGPYKKPLMVDVFDSAGKAVRAQVLGTEDDTFYAYLKYGNAINVEATRLRIAIPVEVPAFGYSVYRVVPKQAAARPVDTISREPHVLENAFLRAEVQSDGTVSLTDKKTGQVFAGLNAFEDEGECGGPLVHYRTNGDACYTTFGQPAAVALVANGPLLATFRIERDWELPEGLENEIKVHVPHGSEWIDHGALRRSSRKALVRIVTEITLRHNSRQLEFSTTVDNRCQDHRLRVLFPSGLEKASHGHVDSAFDVVQRPIAVPDSTGWYEEAARTLPTLSFVDVSDGKKGLAVLHYGFSEYEIQDNPSRTIALTMLRCFGTAGNPTETHVFQSLAQCQGRQVFRYAVMPHEGDWQKGAVPQAASRFTSPLRAIVATTHTGDLMPFHSFLAIDRAEFLVTALKKAEYENAVVLRGYNPTREDFEVTLSIPENTTSVTEVTLEEKPVAELKVGKGRVTFKAPKGGIVSLMIKTK
jgi:mannosylglycerate hydrolase